MKLTNINARLDTSGRHNDRNFDTELASHIDISKTNQNKYTTYLGDDYVGTFRDLEIEFYGKTFDEYINERNQKQLSKRHPERVISTEKYYHMKMSHPEDKIIQIGNIDEHIDADTLWDCCKEYMNDFNDKYGEHCQIIDMALHVDEATPHVHIRRVWIAEDEEGLKYVSQKDALEQMGVKAPHPEDEVSKFNNPKMTFTQKDTRMLLEICKSKGIEIDNSEYKGKQKHLSIEQYKSEKERVRNEYEADILRLKKEKENEQKDISLIENYLDKYLEILYNNQVFDGYKKEIEDAKKKGYDAKYAVLQDFFENEMAYFEDMMNGDISFPQMIRYIQLNDELRYATRFIKEKGLGEEYTEYLKSMDKNNIEL